MCLEWLCEEILPKPAYNNGVSISQVGRDGTDEFILGIKHWSVEKTTKGMISRIDPLNFIS